MHFFRTLIVSATLLLVLARCATYSSKIQGPRNNFEAGNIDGAVAELKQLVESKDNDQLLYLMDLGLIFHSAGRYQEAVDTFLKADKLVDHSDYTSLTEEAGAVLLNDNIKPYKNEMFEGLLVSTYLAIDYTMLGKYDDALVECRRINRRIDKMKGKKPEEQNAFAKYLAAVLFEARGEWNDAFVDYRQLYKWHGPRSSFPYLQGPLMRLANKMGATQEYEEYRKTFDKAIPSRLGKTYGEVVVLLETGRIPIKVPNPSFRLAPMFQRRYYASDHGRVQVKALGKPVSTYPLFDVESTAIKELDDRMAGIIAKKLAGVATKEAAAYGVREATKSDLAGALTSLFLHVQDQADLRSWSTLPAKLQVARFSLPSGRYDVSLDMVLQSGEAKNAKLWPQVDVKPGQIRFLHFRYKD